MPVILIANDQEWSSRSLETILVSEGYAVERAYTGQQALERAAATLPDLIVLDFQLPDLVGPDVCRRLRADPLFGPATPIFITTAGSNGRSRQMEVYEAGAWEFFTQPFDGPLFLLKVRNCLAAKEAYEKARRGMLLDPDTGLYTAGGVALRAREVAALARRKRQPMAVMFLAPGDDALRRAAGEIDAVTRRLSRTLRGALRLADSVGTTKTLQFAVVAPVTDEQGARQIVHRMRSVLESPEAERLCLRGGICATEAAPAELPNPLEMLRVAEDALNRTTSAEPVVCVTLPAAPSAPAG